MARGTLHRKKFKQFEDSLERRSRLIRKEQKKAGNKTPLTKKYRVRVEAHRGANRVEYQNTLKAFKKAIDLDTDGIELDVWLTRDKVAIVTHGSTEEGKLELGAFRKNIQDVLASELQNLTLPDGSKIPTLEQVLSYMDELEFPISLNIELKGHNHELVQKVVESVERHNAWGQVFLSSFNHSFRVTLEESLRYYKINREVTFGYLWNHKHELPNFDELLIKPNDIFTIEAGLLLKSPNDVVTELLKHARSKGLRLGFYFSMVHQETEDDFKKLLDAGADCLIVNDVEKASKFLETSQPQMLSA